MILVAISLLTAAVLIFTTWETTETLKKAAGGTAAPHRPAAAHAVDPTPGARQAAMSRRACRLPS